MYEPANLLYDEPVELLKEKVSEQVNRARWTGDWNEIIDAAHYDEKYNDVPEYLQRQFSHYLSSLKEREAFNYQKFDASLAALRKTCLLTHTMGLGKTRITLLTVCLLDIPAIVVALPRLVRKVWANELSNIGITDWKILERPKRSRQVLKKKTGGKVEDLKGLKGIGRLSLNRINRDEHATADVLHPAKIKIVSYNMLLPGPQDLDYVVCPKCSYKHNREKCPRVKIDIFREILSDTDKGFLDRLAAKYRKGKIHYDGLSSEIKKRFGEDVDFSVSTCNIPMKGSLCPKCSEKGIKSTLGNKKNSGYHCSMCGYSARTWQPPITRRLKKRIKLVALDESQAVKNRSALRSRFTLSIRPRYRHLISGTPATADIAHDLYYQLEWLLGKGVMFPFTSKKNFIDTLNMLTPEEKISFLHKLLDPVQIRREIDDYGVSVDVELPPVRERRISFSMSPVEVENYERASRDVLTWLTENGRKANDLDLFSKMWLLRRAACVPWIDNPNIKESTKINAIKVEVDTYLAQGKKVLIGTEMLDMLDALVENINGAERIDGSTSIKNADRIISLFQDACPECNISLVEEFGRLICPICEKEYKTPQVLAVSRKSIREGVNLNKASCVIISDPSWTYAEMVQFVARARRIGASYDLLDVVYMESKGTIETRMYDVVEERKIEIMEAINRKSGNRTEKIDIRNFVSELFAINLSAPLERNL